MTVLETGILPLDDAPMCCHNAFLATAIALYHLIRKYASTIFLTIIASMAIAKLFADNYESWRLIAG